MTVFSNTSSEGAELAGDKPNGFSPARLRLLFITQKLHGQDAFGALWARAFVERGYEVTVLCLEARPELVAKMLGCNDTLPFEIHSMGKEEGIGTIRQVLRFWRHITTLDYNRVFIHMSPVWGLLGAWYWWPKRLPVYLWYTHYKMQAGLKLLCRYAKRLFCATSQSLPQYEGNPKKIVTGHGIDLTYWPRRANQCVDPYHVLGVYRLSRSKRLELCLRALALLPPAYTWQIYGIAAEPEYVAEMRALVEELRLESRVTFHGTAAVKDLPEIYAKHRLILNMASETIDKTMLEAMTCGCYPVTTARNAAAMGIPAAPAEDAPEAIAVFIHQYHDHSPISAEAMYRVVEERHSLEKLVATMDSFIRPGR